jgi:hypothetical protein
MGNVIEPILADCGIHNRNQEEIKELEEEIRKVSLQSPKLACF